MNTALTLPSAPADTLALVASGQVRPDALGLALLALAPEDGRLHLQALPVLVQAQTAIVGIGSDTEVPLLPLMLPKQAATTALIDTSVFQVVSLITSLRLAEAGDEAADFAAVIAEREERTITVINRRGVPVRVPIQMNPDRAWAYLQTVIRAKDHKWRREVLRQLGSLFLGYLIACRREDKLEVDGDEWDVVMDLCPEKFLDNARAHAGRDTPSEALEWELIKRHRVAMKAAFTLPEDTLATEAAAPTSADQLADSLDLG